MMCHGKNGKGGKASGSSAFRSLALLLSFLAADAFSLTSLGAAFAPKNLPPEALQLHHPERMRYVSANANDRSLGSLIAYPSLAISDSNLPGLPEQRSQDQQIQAALPLGGTVRDTKWRVREERGPAFFVGDGNSNNKEQAKQTTYCTSTVTFRGIAGDANRGTVDYDPGTCITELEAAQSNSIYGKSKGLRWVSKTTRVIQLTARWKVKLPEGKFIYKGYIDGGRRRQIEGKSGQSNLEMTGTILTGDDDSSNRVVGKFTADLIERLE